MTPANGAGSAPASVRWCRPGQHARAASLAGSQAWRLQPPKATLRAMEAAREARLAELRARMRAEVALASQAADGRQPGAHRGGG